MYHDMSYILDSMEILQLLGGPYRPHPLLGKTHISFIHINEKTYQNTKGQHHKENIKDHNLV